ncbi:hypothetical protein B0W47_01770 [Komagataeibacter nataicola]|uniref:Uncharacterized protein n=1 Tax=Komagataeibacter nataicola TaxID=265960 RepID=A0A9N7CF47_9PROT|nr:hypothetical protein [Komagataeibacter nataicola]AQU86390.1 hypothetical protein B0W47_01770 [Komagataeibacter nataicola]PYD65554.1 hypothetical protein CDI09_12840 [Komagataeibacter nataicola]WEQ56722.1 hypothetical protein LV564_06515 [Komagataeibacter nataicola]WNM08194.1 hypothetical protein RI056_15050 [Komagataeibacter nataicola]GBR25518.1 hypothetical protein AA0616_2995 [Komagataeibacter nataicola NRIC 0616]
MSETIPPTQGGPVATIRCATVEDLARVRERLAKVEGGHDNLRDGLNTLSQQFADLRRDLTQSVTDNAAQTRREIMERVDDMTDTATERNNEISGRLARIEGGLRLTSWVTMTFIVLATGLLGWGQIGDAAFAFCKRALGYGP